MKLNTNLTIVERILVESLATLLASLTKNAINLPFFISSTFSILDRRNLANNLSTKSLDIINSIFTSMFFHTTLTPIYPKQIPASFAISMKIAFLFLSISYKRPIILPTILDGIATRYTLMIKNIVSIKNIHLYFLYNSSSIFFNLIPP